MRLANSLLCSLTRIAGLLLVFNTLSNALQQRHPVMRRQGEGVNESTVLHFRQFEKKNVHPLCLLGMLSLQSIESF